MYGMSGHVLNPNPSNIRSNTTTEKRTAFCLVIMRPEASWTNHSIPFGWNASRTQTFKTA
eukprot:16234308-Heterocapsa_arctica.AAC.1